MWSCYCVRGSSICGNFAFVNFLSSSPLMLLRYEQDHYCRDFSSLVALDGSLPSVPRALSRTEGTSGPHNGLVHPPPSIFKWMAIQLKASSTSCPVYPILEVLAPCVADGVWGGVERAAAISAARSHNIAVQGCAMVSGYSPCERTRQICLCFDEISRSRNLLTPRSAKLSPYSLASLFVARDPSTPRESLSPHLKVPSSGESRSSKTKSSSSFSSRVRSISMGSPNTSSGRKRERPNSSSNSPATLQAVESAPTSIPFFVASLDPILRGRFTLLLIPENSQSQRPSELAPVFSPRSSSPSKNMHDELSEDLEYPVFVAFSLLLSRSAALRSSPQILSVSSSTLSNEASSSSQRVVISMHREGLKLKDLDTLPFGARPTLRDSLRFGLIVVCCRCCSSSQRSSCALPPLSPTALAFWCIYIDRKR